MTFDTNSNNKGGGGGGGDASCPANVFGWFCPPTGNLLVHRRHRRKPAKRIHPHDKNNNRGFHNFCKRSTPSDGLPTSDSFRRNLLLEGTGNVYDFYEHLETVGEGSISTISKVRKKRVGGSARHDYGDRRRSSSFGWMLRSHHGHTHKTGGGCLPWSKPSRDDLSVGSSTSGVSGGSSKPYFFTAMNGKGLGSSVLGRLFLRTTASAEEGGGGDRDGDKNNNKKEEAGMNGTHETHQSLDAPCARPDRIGGSVRFGSDSAHGDAQGTETESEILPPPPEGDDKDGSANTDNNQKREPIDHSALSPYRDDSVTSSLGASGGGYNYVRRHNEFIFALKAIDLRVVNDENLRELRNEIEVLKTLDHPNIVKAYETFHRKKEIYLIMEHLTGGDLHARHPYTEREAANIVGKVLSAIVYMHKNGIMHRDIKYENILFENSRPNAEVKLIDFGLSKFLDPNHQFSERVGTVYTMAPEVLLGHYSFSADMWSLGVVSFMLLSGYKPFWGRKKKSIIKKILHGEIDFSDPAWTFISKEAKDFVALLLQKDPYKRPTAEEAQAHAWLHKEYKLSSRRPGEDVMLGVKESLVRYADSGEFKKVALNVIAHKSTPEQIFQIRSVFDQYDSNNDGSISYNGFKVALAKFNFTEEELDRMFSSIDVNSDGVIYFTEFLAATLETQGRIEEHRLAEAFDRLDADDTGYISKANLRDILGRKCTEEYLEKLMAEVDIDKNQKISYDEFLSVFLRKKRREIRAMCDADKHVSSASVHFDSEHVKTKGSKRKSRVGALIKAQ